MKEMRRMLRVQTCRTALYVHLPVVYVRKVGLRPGDLVLVEMEQDGTLVLRPLELRIKKLSSEGGAPAPRPEEIQEKTTTEEARTP